MNFEQFVHSIPAWLSGEGPESGIVISSRARLARNIRGIVYAHRADDEQLAEVVGYVLDAAQFAGYDSCNFIRTDDLDELHKHILIERHLISTMMASKSGNRGVIFMNGELNSILVNEEDHLRFQSLRSGFDPLGVLNEVEALESAVARALNFSFSPRYGYLTACPTNIGTGLRVSVLIHLPALVLTKEIHRVIRSSSQLGLAVRGYYGEGSDVIGNLFQISNQRSLGKNVQELTRALESVVKRIIEYETQSAETLMEEAKNQTEDKIARSIGILKTARVLSTHEFMNLCSAVRLGCFIGFVDKNYVHILNDLLILTQPGHLGERYGLKEDAMERDYMRAELVRERFVDVKL